MDSDSKKKLDYGSLRSRVFDQIISPGYFNDCEQLSRDRKNYRIMGDVCETISKVFLGASSIISFAAGFFDDKMYSFIAGAVSVLSLVCQQFALFSSGESSERTNELNTILQKLRIDTVPELVNESLAIEEPTEEKKIISNNGHQTVHQYSREEHKENPLL